MKTVAVLFLMFCAITSTYAQVPGIVASSEPGWHKIGHVKADFKTESESISVLGKDRFKALKFKVTDAPINISRIIVYYEDETSQEIPVSGTLASGSETGQFDLKSPSKEIKKVTFTYRSEPNYQGDKAHVELYGLK